MRGQQAFLSADIGHKLLKEKNARGPNFECPCSNSGQALFRCTKGAVAASVHVFARGYVRKPFFLNGCSGAEAEVQERLASLKSEANAVIERPIH